MRVISASPVVLTLPGWQGSGPAHWQSRGERAHGWRRVQQHDWQRPLRGDWTARLQDVVLAQPPTRPLLLVAHGLGCLLTAWWAAHSPQARRVRGALLVAPPDMARADNRARIPGWAAPAAPGPMPFASVLVASSDDPGCSLESASQLAHHWGSSFYHLGPYGCIDSLSGLGDWEEGLRLLDALAPVHDISNPTHENPP